MSHENRKIFQGSDAPKWGMVPWKMTIQGKDSSKLFRVLESHAIRQGRTFTEPCDENPVRINVVGILGFFNRVKDIILNQRIS